MIVNPATYHKTCSAPHFATPSQISVRPSCCNKNTCNNIIPLRMVRHDDDHDLIHGRLPRSYIYACTNLPDTISPLHCLAANEPSSSQVGRCVTFPAGKWYVYEHLARKTKYMWKCLAGPNKRQFTQHYRIMDDVAYICLANTFRLMGDKTIRVRIAFCGRHIWERGNL